MQFSIEKNYTKEQKEIIIKLKSKLSAKEKQINILNQKIADIKNEKQNKELSTPPLTSNLDLYIPKVIPDNLKNPNTHIEGKRKFLTILQAKMANVNKLYKQLPAKGYVTLYNKIFKQIFSIIYKNYGIITQINGESLQGTFGLFSENNNKEADNALNSANEIQQKLNAINKYLIEKKLSTINISSGIHSGQVVVGKMENHQNSGLFIMGDHAKIAEMVENMSKKYYFSTIISETTKNISNSKLYFNEVGFLEICGSNKKLKIYKIA